MHLSTRLGWLPTPCPLGLPFLLFQINSKHSFLQLLTEELKEQLEPLADMPAGRQRLIYRGRMLENGSTLGSAGLSQPGLNEPHPLHSPLKSHRSSVHA